MSEKKNLCAKTAVAQIANGVLAGIMIGIGGCVSLSCDNKYIGALLFSLGLFAIIQFGFGLFTGKVGYIPLRKPVYIWECFFTLVGNALGTLFDALLLRHTRIDLAIEQKAQSILDAKLGDTWHSMFIMAIFCGMLMFLAVDNARISRKSGGHSELVTGTLLCIVVFIICGFNHCIADMFYLFLTMRIKEGLVYLSFVILGNVVGGMTIPLIKNLTGTPFEHQ